MWISVSFLSLIQETIRQPAIGQMAGGFPGQDELVILLPSSATGPWV